MAHDVHLTDKTLQITKLDCKKRTYEQYCTHELHISAFPTLVWMKDGKIEKTYASHKVSIDSLKQFVSENLHGHHVLKPTHHVPKLVHHVIHHKVMKTHTDHHYPKGHKESSSSSESHSHGHEKTHDHLVYHHPAAATKKNHMTSAEHNLLKKFLKKAYEHHSNEHHDLHDIHNHIQNDQHHIDQISKVHEKSKISHNKIIRKHPGLHIQKSMFHDEHHQIAPPKIFDNKHHKPIHHDLKHAEDEKFKKKLPKHMIPHPKRPLRHPIKSYRHKKKPSKSHKMLKIMKLNAHDFKSSLSRTGATFVIFYGEKTKNPAHNERVRFIKHVAQRYIRNNHPMGEVNCKLAENAALCKQEKFVADPMVNIYKKGVMVRHNYQFVHKSGEMRLYLS